MSKDDDLFVTISKEEYDNLIKSYNFLLALQAAGVDNWEGYEYACENIYES